MTNISKEQLEEIRSIVDPNYSVMLRRKRLYEKGFKGLPHLPTLAMEWFQEIANEVSPLPDELWFSRRRPGEEFVERAPDWLYHEDTFEAPPPGRIRRVRVGGSQTLLVWPGRERTPEGYKPMVVSDEFFRTDMAVLAVLIIMEADRARPKELYQYNGTEPELDFAKTLLRYYRGSEFEGLSPKDKNDLTVRTYSRMYEVLDSLRNLMAFLEYGEPNKNLTTHPLETFRRDVRAAELKHIDKPIRQRLGKQRLTNYGIARKLNEEGLNLEPPDRWVDKRHYEEKYARKASDSARRGEKISAEALGEAGFEEQVETSKAEFERWETLDTEDRLVERLADLEEDSADVIRISYRSMLREVFSRLLRGDQSVLEELRQDFPPTVELPP